MKAGALQIIMILVLAACGGGEVTILSPDELPPDLYASPSPTRAPTPVSRTLQVFFVHGDRLAETTVVRQASSNPLEEAIQVLMEGPGPAEAAAGLFSAIPPDVQVLGASLNGAIATVNLSGEFEAAAEERVLILRVAQVVYTATGLPGVERVRFRVEGEPVDVLAGATESPEEGVGRAHFSELAPIE